MRNAEGPVSGERLAKSLGVSRQVIVQDIALLRAADHDILATNRGYLYTASSEAGRVFHVNHKNEEMEEELISWWISGRQWWMCLWSISPTES